MNAKNLKIFIVEDSDPMREAIKIKVQQLKLEVVGEAICPEEAFDKCVILKPDIVISDIKLIDGDGLALCRELKKEIPGIKVVLITAYMDILEPFAAAHDVGADVLVSKAFDLELLENTILRITNRA